LRVNDNSAAILGVEWAGHDNDEKEPLWRRILSIFFTLAVVVFTIYFWPAVLGGATRMITVSGHSMEPTYDSNDIVVTRDAGDVRIGEVVVFAVPEGPAEGMLVIHRVLEVDNEGFFITQGDNRGTPDQWLLTEDDIVGQPVAHIPRGGMFLDLLRNIWVIAGLIGFIVLFVLWPDDEDTEVETDTDETESLERDAVWTVVEAPVAPIRAVNMTVSASELAESWLEREREQPIDDDVMAEAFAWLDKQLESFSQPVAQ
jgi:signal peptidase